MLNKISIFAVVIVLIVVVVLVNRGASHPSVVTSMGEESANQLMETEDLVVGSSVQTQSNVLPEHLKNTSLKGTSIDGLYPVDNQGNLLLSKDIKNRFEYFLSTMGEFEIAQVMDMIKEDIALNLVSPAKEQALKLFDDYIAYKYALADLEASLDTPEDYEIHDIERMRSQLQQMRNVRREYLSSDAVDAFFGFDEMYDDFMLARLEVQNNQQLSAQEKQQQLDGLEDSLPQDVKIMREETQRISQVFLLTEEVKKQGGTEQDVYDINEQEFGQEAAQRLQVLEQQRQQWQNRVNRFMVKKHSIEQDENLSDAEKSRAIENTRSTMFEQTEYTKLSAYELMYEEASAQ